MAITLDRSLYRKALEEKTSFSAVLEEMFDEAGEERENGLDAFESMLKRNGIRTKSIYGKGIPASEVQAFYRTEEHKLLFPEFINRNLRAAFESYAPLDLLIGARTLVDSPKVDTYYIDMPDAKKTRKRRVTERAEMTPAVLGVREQSVRFYKFGMALKASYEAIRRMKVDMLARHIDYIGIQAAKDKVEEIVNVAVNGDGNNNAAPVYNLTTLHSGATAGTLTPEAWLKFLMKFSIFPCDTLVATEEAFVKIVLSQFPNMTVQEVLGLMKSGNTAAVRLNTPQMPQMNQTLIWHPEIAGALTGLKVVGLNRGAAIEELTEAGSTIMEADKFILEQSEVLTISENSGYSKMFKEATAVLDIGA